jgi:hypothetical protein
MILYFFGPIARELGRKNVESDVANCRRVLCQMRMQLQGQGWMSRFVEFDNAKMIQQFRQLLDDPIGLPFPGRLAMWLRHRRVGR